MVERGYCHVWTNCSHHGMQSVSSTEDAICRCWLYRRCVLVHRFNLVRQPRGHDCTHIDRDICGHSTKRCASVHRRAADRREPCIRNDAVAARRLNRRVRATKVGPPLARMLRRPPRQAPRRESPAALRGHDTLTMHANLAVHALVEVGPRLPHWLAAPTARQRHQASNSPPIVSCRFLWHPQTRSASRER